MTPRHDGLDRAVRERRDRRERGRRDRSLAKSLAIAGALGWTIVLPALAGVAAGRWLDRELHSRPCSSPAAPTPGCCRPTTSRWRRGDRARASTRRRRPRCTARRWCRGAATGTATIRWAGRCFLTARSAARIVPPVAMPSSTRITVRSRRSGGVRPARKRSTRRRISFISRRATSRSWARVIPASFSVDRPITTAGPSAIAPMPSSGWKGAKLAHDPHVERSAECAGDLVRHGDSAARQGEHDGIGARIAEQLLCEQTAGAAPVGKHPRSCKAFAG